MEVHRDSAIFTGDKTTNSTGEARCHIPTFDLIVESAGEDAEGDVELVVTEECELSSTKAVWIDRAGIKRHVSSALDHRDPLGRGFAKRVLDTLPGLLPTAVVEADHGLEIRGWAKAEINDLPRIDLAMTYAEFKYSDYGGGVHDAHSPAHDCDRFSVSGWVESSCKGSRSMSGSSLWAKTIGEFYNKFCLGSDKCGRKISSKYKPRGGFAFTGTCTYSRNDPPPGTHYRCTAGFITVD